MTADTEVRGYLPLGDLRECPFHPRRSDPEDALRELAASLTAIGCLQPLVVRPVPATATFAKGAWAGKEYFEVVAGRRRFRAAALARLDRLPVVVRRLSDDDARAVMLAENVHRADLTPFEAAAALAELVGKYGSDGAAERVGLPLSVVPERATCRPLGDEPPAPGSAGQPAPPQPPANGMPEPPIKKRKAVRKTHG